MAAPAAKPVSMCHSGGGKSTGPQPSAPASGAIASKCSVGVGPMPMPLLMPPWMPMMMPPWMPMFGMMTGKPAAPTPSMSMAVPGMSAPQVQKQGPTRSVAAPATQAAAPSPAASPAVAAVGEDDDVKLQPDEEVVVEPEELEVFEKVAAMERDKQQKKQFERASSPSGSCHTTVMGGGGSSSACSPVSTVQPPMPFPPGMGCFPFPPPFSCMPMPPMPCCLPVPAPGLQQGLQQPHQHWQQQHWQQQQQQANTMQPMQQQQQQHPGVDSAPVPWSSFAADDCGDDLDMDLQQLITLPGDEWAQPSSKQAPAAGSVDPAAAAPASATGTEGPAAAAKARSSSLKRIGSSASTYSSIDLLNGAPAAAGNAEQVPGSKTKRVLRIRSIKGAGDANLNSSSSSSKPTSKSSPAAKRTGGSLQQQAVAAPAVSKGGVQKKKVTLNTSRGGVNNSSSKGSSNLNKKLSTAGKLSLVGSKPQAVKAKPPQQQQQQLQAEDPSLSLLGDLDSSLSGGDAMTGGIMAADDYWDTFMQEVSDDGWDSLLPPTDMGFNTAEL